MTPPSRVAGRALDAETVAEHLRAAGYRNYGPSRLHGGAFQPTLWQRRHPTATAPDGDALYVNVYQHDAVTIGNHTTTLSYEVEVYADGFRDEGVQGAATVKLYGFSADALVARLGALESAAIAAVATLYASLDGAA